MGRVRERRRGLAAWMAAMAILVGSVAWGQPVPGIEDRSYDGQAEARGQGYHNGLHDGYYAGQWDRERGRRFKFRNDDWEDSRGYEHWMGSKKEYRYAYRDGYERGYRRGYESSGQWGHDGFRHDGDDWR